MPAAIRVWDLPVRAFHWSLVACVVGLVISGNIGGSAMTWHFRFGYCVATLLLFRIVWGFAGGHWSRFASFIYPPSQVLKRAWGIKGWRVGIPRLVSKKWWINDLFLESEVRFLGTGSL